MQHEIINENYHVLTVQKNGKTWEVRVHVDQDKDGGIEVSIMRDDELCTETSFGWEDRHENESQR